MRFCPTCGRSMLRDSSTGSVMFNCSCGTTEPGLASDARIFGATLGAGETTEMYRRLIQSAPFDRTNQLVNKNCPECGLDYVVQIRVGDAEVIVYKCKCGYESGSAF